MKIGELAISAHCTTETVRFYEKAGLLPKADRTQGNYRDYGPEHLKRLRFIRNCRALDMTHDEIRTLLVTMDAPGDGCDSVGTLIDEHIGHVETRIQELLLLKDQLADLRQQCHAEAAGETCGILRGLETMHSGSAGDRHTHLG
jgi:Cd(II)/Pb(II)-responsive transcriptional regulator